jgi:hypothetical protein
VRLASRPAEEVDPDRSCAEKPTGRVVVKDSLRSSKGGKMSSLGMAPHLVLDLVLHCPKCRTRCTPQRHTNHAWVHCAYALSFLENLLESIPMAEKLV